MKRTRLKVFAAALLLSTAFTSPVVAMPQAIPFIVVGFQVSVGTGLAAIGSVVAAYSGAFLSIGLAIGGQVLASLFAPKPPKAEDVQGNIRQATPWRGALYGEGLLGGPWVFGGSHAGNFHKVIALSSRKLSSILQYWVDDNIVTLGAGGEVLESPYFTGYGYALYIRSRLGEATETYYSQLELAFPEWTSTHRGDGIASLYAVQLAVGSEYIPSLFPNLHNTLYRVRAQGVAVYDPTDGAQSIANPATWTYSDNLARVVMDYLWHVDGMRVPVEMLTTPLALAGWQQAVADCNDPIPVNAGGTEPRYRCWNYYFYNERPGDVLRRMMEAGDAHLVPTRDGGLTLEVGKWVAPDVTIDDDAIVGFEGVGRGRSILQTANTVFSSFTSPDHQFQTVDADPWVDEADVSARGEISIDQPFTCSPSHGQTRRLMKIKAHRAKPEWTGSFILNKRGFAAFGKRYINLVHTLSGIDGTFEIIEFNFMFGEHSTIIGAQISVQSMPASAFAWNAATEEGTPPPFENVDEQAAGLADVDVALVGSAARFTWAALSPTQSMVLFGKKTSDSDWTDITVPAGVTTVDWALAETGEEYEFEAALKNLYGLVGVRANTTPATLTAP